MEHNIIVYTSVFIMQISSGQDWIVYHDEIQQHIAHSQNFIFAMYLPYVSVAFHFLFAAPSKAPIHYPNASYEVCWRHFCVLERIAVSGDSFMHNF